MTLITARSSHRNYERSWRATFPPRGDVDEQEALGQATLWPLSVVQAALRAAPAPLPARTRQAVPLLPIVRAGMSLCGDETTEDRESRLLSSQVMRTQGPMAMLRNDQSAHATRCTLCCARAAKRPCDCHGGCGAVRHFGKFRNGRVVHLTPGRQRKLLK